MLRRYLILFALMPVLLAGCAPESVPETTTDTEAETIVQPCSTEWYRMVEESIPTGDGMGHGPDRGSTEWRSVVEFKLGIRDDPNVPPLESDDWCSYIDQRYVVDAG